MLRFIFALISIFFLSHSLAATPTTHVEKLPNGLTVVVREDHRAPVVFSSVWYKVGSSYEYDGITGISHVLEHMMFRGTKKVPNGQFDQRISAKGGRQNAMTSADFTMYYQLLPAKQLALSFELEADRMRNLVLSPTLFSKEVNVVQEERRLRTDDNPQALTWERMKAAAYVSNPYHHPVIGWMSDLKSLTVQDLATWYQKWYSPANAVVVVVGDVQPKDVFALAKRYFGPLPKVSVPTVKPRTGVTQLGKRVVSVSAPAKLPWVVMAFNVPSIKTAEQTWQPYALALMAGILDAGKSARLSQHLIRKNLIAVSASAGYDPFSLHSNLFVFEGIPTVNKKVEDLQSAVWDEIKALQKTAVSKEELARVKAQLIAQKIYEKDALQTQGMDIGTPMMLGLSWRDADEYVARILAITPAQIQQVANQYFTPKRLTVAILKPIKKA